MSDDVKNTAPAPQPENAAPAGTAQPEAPAPADTAPTEAPAPADNPQPEAAKPAEEAKTEEKKPDPVEEARRIAHERAVAVVAEALKPEGPPDPLEPFFSLCARGTTDEVRAAIAAGADVNKANNAGSMPLHRAVTNNTYDVVRCLVEAGADVNARTTGTYRDTVLHSAIWTKDPRVIHLLLEHGAEPYVLDTREWTPLHLATYHVRGHEIIDPILQAMKPVPAAPAKRYKGTVEYIDSWNRRAYQLVDGKLIEHNLRRVGPGIYLGHLVIVQYAATGKSKARVENLTLKDEMEKYK